MMSGFFSLLYKIQYQFRIWLINALIRFRKSKTPGSLPENPRFLFVTVGLLGDTVMSIPSILKARELWPKAHIAVLGKKSNLDLLDNCPAIDQYQESPIIPFSLKKGRQKKKVFNWVKQQQFDISIILLGDQFGKMLYDASIPVRIGVKEHPLEACHTHLYDIIGPSKWTPHERLNSLRCLGYDIEDCLPKLWYSSSDKPTYLPQEYIVLHPFGSTRRQWWNLEEIPRLASELFNRYQLPIVLIGGKEIQGMVPVHPNIIDTTGTLSLLQLKAAIAESRFVISTDSGPFHIAGAFNKTIVGLFRARRPELARIFPKGHVLFGQNETCELQCKWDKCRNEKCDQLYNINAAQVLSKIEELYPCQK